MPSYKYDIRADTRDAQHATEQLAQKTDSLEDLMKKGQAAAQAYAQSVSLTSKEASALGRQMNLSSSEVRKLVASEKLAATEARALAKAQQEAEAKTRRLTDAANDSADKLGTLAAGMKLLGGAVAALGLANLAGKGLDFLGGAVESAKEAERALAQTEAAIRSTGGAAGLGASQIAAIATSLSDLTAIEDDTIQQTENLLLTFTNIKGDVFRETTAAVLDMSVAMGQDLSSSAVQVGKALNNPLEGLTALTRVGVTFSATQKQLITDMMAVGDVAGAQRIILAELNKEFGGSAAAAAQTASGSIQQFQNDLANTTEDIGGKVLPVLGVLADRLGPRLVAAVNESIPAIERLAAIAEEAIGGVADDLDTRDAFAMSSRSATEYIQRMEDAGQATAGLSHALATNQNLTAMQFYEVSRLTAQYTRLHGELQNDAVERTERNMRNAAAATREATAATHDHAAATEEDADKERESEQAARDHEQVVRSLTQALQEQFRIERGIAGEAQAWIDATSAGDAYLDFLEAAGVDLSQFPGYYDRIRQSTGMITAAQFEMEQGFRLLGPAIEAGLITPLQGQKVFEEWRTGAIKDIDALQARIDQFEQYNEQKPPIVLHPPQMDAGEVEAFAETGMRPIEDKAAEVGQNAARNLGDPVNEALKAANAKFDEMTSKLDVLGLLATEAFSAMQAAAAAAAGEGGLGKVNFLVNSLRDDWSWLMQNSSIALSASISQTGQVPRADGGMVQPGEVSLVGERGPELAVLPPGTQVIPAGLTRQLLAGGMASGGIVGGGALSLGSQEIVINLDGREIARAVIDPMEREYRARGMNVGVPVT